jgi:CIC family chloride channel protein
MGRLAFGIEPAFLVAAYERPELFVPLSVDMLPLYVLFGLIAGVGATIFVKVLYGTEDLFDRIKVNDYIKNIVAMTTLGVMFYVLMLTTGMYHTAGVGYATIEAILTGQISAPGFLLLLFVLKLAATTISLAGGSSGGVFSPSLFLGAALGGTFGGLLDMAFPYLGFSSVTFALIGMAAIVGGSTGAAMTSIMMLFEMTGDYSITLAAIVAVVCAVGVRSGLSPQDIYTTKLARRGRHIPRDRRSHMFAIRMAREVMEPVAGTIAREDLPATVSMSPVQEGERSFALVTEGRFIVGIVPVDPENPDRVIGSIIGPVGVVRETSFLQSAMTHMVDRGHAAVVVSPDRRIPRPENVVGVLTRDAIADAVMRDYRT